MNEKSLKEYYLNPNICEYCNGIIHAKITEKLGHVRRKRFCNLSCSSKYTNAKCLRKQPVKHLYCEKCGDILPYTVSKKNGKRLVRKTCLRCYKNSKGQTRGLIENRTKSELFSNRKNYQSARGNIQKQAREIYLKSNNEMKCKICGYDKHVDICHIKAVSEFNGACLIRDINSISNLVALCKNHHWELDNGFLKL